MGLFDRGATKRKIAPLPAPVASWGSDTEIAAAGIDTADALWFATVHAMLTVDHRSATSAWRAPDQKREDSFSAFLAATNVVIQAERVNANSSSICSGGSGPLVASKDWTAQMDLDQQVVEVSQAATRDDKLINDKLLDGVRQKLIEGVGSRRYGLRTVQAAPSQADVVVNAPCGLSDPYSPFKYDLLSQPPAWFSSLVTITLGVAPSEDARRLLDIVLAPFLQPDGSYSLTAGSADLPLSVQVSEDHEGTQLALAWRTPPSDHAARIGAHVTLRLLSLLNESFVATWPTAAAAIQDKVTALSNGWAAAQTGAEAGASWTKKVPRPTIELTPGASVPVVMTIVSSGSVAGHLQDATFWIPSYSWRWTKGITKRAQANAIDLTRRAGLVRRDDGRVTPWVRFAEVEKSRRELPADVRTWNSWFWELQISAKSLEDGRTESRLMVTGLSRVGDAVAYGAELVEYLSVLAALTSAGDPDATVTTQYLTV